MTSTMICRTDMTTDSTPQGKAEQEEIARQYRERESERLVRKQIEDQESASTRTNIMAGYVAPSKELLQGIIEYAESRGVSNVRIVDELAFGYSLFGDGIDEHGWPLVWRVAEECGISRGCGSTGRHQIQPGRFVRANVKGIGAGTASG